MKKTENNLICGGCGKEIKKEDKKVKIYSSYDWFMPPITYIVHNNKECVNSVFNGKIKK